MTLNTNTTYPVPVEVFTTTPVRVSREITDEEWQLILRGREARRSGEIDKFLWNVRKMTLEPVGDIERLAR